MALDSHPLKPGKKHVGQRDVPVTFAGVTIHPGDWLYADEGESCGSASPRRALACCRLPAAAQRC
jgi:regulator of ribonuclease activity A